MGDIKTADRVLKFCAIFGHCSDALVWARDRLRDQWGGLAISSPEFEFTETHYYASEMGESLKKQLLLFPDWEAPDWLPAAKHETNRWEQEYRETAGSDVRRPLNMDPGYLTMAKLVLATTKDRDHRLYLGQGIYGEVTLHYKHGRWRGDRWTYPDYQRADYHEFLDQCRDYLKQLRKTHAT